MPHAVDRFGAVFNIEELAKFKQPRIILLGIAGDFRGWDPLPPRGDESA